MELYLYVDRDTRLHRLDPRTKMGLLLSLFVLAFVVEDPRYVAVVLGLVLVVVSAAHVWTNVVKALLPLAVVAVVTVVLFALTSPGTTRLFWVVTGEGLQDGVTAAVRLVALIVSGLVFLSITTNEELAIGLVKLGLPCRFSFAISTAMRLVPTILGTAVTIVQAQRSRGYDIDSGNILVRVRNVAPIIVPVFVSTIRSTQVFAMALESKGFGADRRRTYLQDPHFTRADVTVWIGLALVLAAAVVLRSMGYGGLDGR